MEIVLEHTHIAAPQVGSFAAFAVIRLKWIKRLLPFIAALQFDIFLEILFQRLHLL